MPDLHFCPGCGAAIQPDDLFCTACGFALSAIKKSDVQTSAVVSKEKETIIKPVPSKRNTGNNPNSKYLPLVILVIVGAFTGLYFWEKSKEKTDGKLPVNKVNPITIVDSPKKDNKTIIPDTKLPGSFSIEDYTGEWQLYESNKSGDMQPEEGRAEDDLIIEKENGRLILYPRGRADQQMSTDMSCNQPVGHVLSCRAKDEHEGTMATITLELSLAKDDLTLTFIPDEPTEKMIAKLRRIK
jgi:hypothetical protein